MYERTGRQTIVLSTPLRQYRTCRWSYHVKHWPKFFREDLSKVLSLLAKGNIQARVDRRLPLEKASEALGLLASGRVSGKVVLVLGLVAGESL